MSKDNQLPGDGFTLIEISIVLMIIGLIVGGILVGQDMIKAAEIRAAISQIEKYNTAVNVFRTKYGSVPGDMPGTKAAQFGMTARSGLVGHGDGDTILNACNVGPVQANGTYMGCELLLFWNDLSSANLIDGNFTTATDAMLSTTDNSLIPFYVPASKLGRGNKVHAGADPTASTNVFYMVAIYSVGLAGALFNRDAITPSEASAIDSKADDGFPLNGRVIAIFNFLGSLPPATPSGITCVFTGGLQYNTTTSTLAETPLCSLRIRMS